MQREQHEDNDENIKKKMKQRNDTKMITKNKEFDLLWLLHIGNDMALACATPLSTSTIDIDASCVAQSTLIPFILLAGWFCRLTFFASFDFLFFFFFVLICFFIASFEDIATSTNPLDKWTTRYRYPFTRLRLHDGFHSLSRFLSFMFLLHISDLLDLRLDINRRCNRGTQHPVIQKWKRNKKKANTILSFSLYFFLYFLFHFIQFSFLFTKLLRAKYHHADPTRSFNFNFEFWITIRPLYSIWFQHACVMIRSNQMKMKTDEMRNDISSLPPWW